MDHPYDWGAFSFPASGFRKKSGGSDLCKSLRNWFLQSKPASQLTPGIMATPSPAPKFAAYLSHLWAKRAEAPILGTF